jgi:predicted amidohydrolase
MLPEMFTVPYQKNYMVPYAESIELGHEKAVTANLLSELAQKTSTYIIGGSIPEAVSENKIFNTCLCFDREGKITA